MSRQTPNTFKNPIVTTITNPVGIDRVIQSIQLAYTTNLTWLESSFGRAFVMQNKTESARLESVLSRSDTKFPVVWQGDNIDRLNVLANDNLDSYSFFFKDGSETAIEWEQFNQNKWECEISNIFWLDLKRVDSSKTYLYSEELLEDIKRVIRNTVFSDGDSVEILSITEEPSEIFQEFTLDLSETQHLTYPKHGFRIKLKAIYTEGC